MMKYFLLIACMVLSGVVTAGAQEAADGFTVRVFVGSDAEPPTTPNILSVVPISQSQIDVSWSTATDNFVVNGYSLLRDGVPIATTTLTSYSDTGLLASTTYGYQVRAFDVALNYSTSSTLVATTTLPVPVVPPDPVVLEQSGVANAAASGSGTAVRAVIDELMVLVSESTARMDLLTARPARIELRWGRTGSYELGYVTSDIHKTQHSVLITDLEPNTTYEYQLIGYTPQGIQTVLKTSEFTTSSVDGARQPANVTRFVAVQQDTDVQLSWELPVLESGSYVRIVRSHLGFPRYPQDGAIVYQGENRSVLDAGILLRYSPIYYTAFVYGADGSVSSGAVAIVYAQDSGSGGQPGSGGEVSPIIPGQEEDPFVGLPTQDINEIFNTADMVLPGLEDIFLIQGDRVFSMNTTDIMLDYQQDFTISIPVAVVSDSLKSIIVTILDPTNNNRRYSFLLRINNDQTAYEAVLSPLQLVGESRLIVEIFDYESNIISTYKSSLRFAAVDTGNVPVVFPDVFFTNPANIALATTLPILVLLLILLLARRRAEDNK